MNKLLTNAKIISLCTILFLYGCGGGGGGVADAPSGTVPDTTLPDTKTYKGVILDSAIQGLSYTTSSGENGITTALGEFTYQQDDEITFSIAGIILPSVVAKSVITPFDILDTNDLYDPKLVNLLRVIQSLDDDGEISTSISLSDEKLALIDKTGIDFQDFSLETDAFSALVANKALINISADAAIQHFITTLASSKMIDSDLDGKNNLLDTDDDNDGIEDVSDAFPWNAAEYRDFDGDNVGDNADLDDDNDGILDEKDSKLSIISALEESGSNASHQIFSSLTNQLFLTYQSEKTLQIIDVDTAEVTQTISFEKMPSRMTLSPDGTSLYVALLDRDFQYYDSNEGSGTILVFNVANLSQINSFDISIDPFDLVATDEGKVIVSSGSNQWTTVQAYNAINGSLLGSSNIRHRSYLALSPSQEWVYSVHTDTTDDQIYRYDITGEGITSASYSVHNSHNVSNRIWASSNGKYLFSQAGTIFLASDMSYVGQVENSTIINNIIFDQESNIAFVVDSVGNIKIVNLSSLEVFSSVAVYGEANNVFIANDGVYYLSSEDDALSITKVEHPCPSCATNTKPSATFTYTPMSKGTTLDTYEFDASNSSDVEDGNTLQYRWRMNAHEQWDTEFSSNPTYSHQFIIAGEKFVSVQVKDSKGLTKIETLELDVTQGIDPGTEVNDSDAYTLTFNVTDVIENPNSNKSYITDKTAKRLYIVNLETGLTEKYFEFTLMPERMAISPDGEELYVSLLTQEHSSYIWEEDQSGFIARFDLNEETQVNLYEIPTDPYDLVVNDQNKLIVSSGSGQWTDIYAFDASDGSVLGKTLIRQQSRLTLHPSGDYVFAADTDSSPSDFEKFDISGAGIVAMGDSPYHGNYYIAGNVWATPDGAYIIARGGHVFLTSDMTYVLTLEALGENITTITDIAFDTDGGFLYVLSGQAIQQFNINTFDYIQREIDQDVSHLLLVNDILQGIKTVGISSQVVTYAFD